MKRIIAAFVLAVFVYGCAQGPTIPPSSTRVDPASGKVLTECLTDYCAGFEGVWKAQGSRTYYLYIGPNPNSNRLVFAWQSLDEIDFEFFDQYLLANDIDFCFVALGDDVLYEKIEVLTPNRIKFWIFTYNRVTSKTEQARAMRILFE